MKSSLKAHSQTIFIFWGKEENNWIFSSWIKERSLTAFVSTNSQPVSISNCVYFTLMGCSIHLSFALISSKVLAADTNMSGWAKILQWHPQLLHIVLYVHDNDTHTTEVSTLSLYRKKLQMENCCHSLVLLLNGPIHDTLRNAEGTTLDLHHYTNTVYS